MSFEDAVAAAVARDRPKRGPEPLSFTFRLPLPPTVNHYFLERVVFSKKFKKYVILKTPGPRGVEFRTQVGQALMAQRIPLRVLTGKLMIGVMVMAEDRRRRDLDNLLKPLLDALVRAELITDDSEIDYLTIERCLPQPEAHVLVTIAEIAGEPTTSGRLDL